MYPTFRGPGPACQLELRLWLQSNPHISLLSSTDSLIDLILLPSEESLLQPHRRLIHHALMNLAKVSRCPSDVLELVL